MGFLSSLFKSQLPDIIKRLDNIGHDLTTTQKNIEQLLLFEETYNGKKDELIKSAIDEWGVAMWLKDLNSRFLYANKACLDKILKCTLEEALNLKNGDLKNDMLAQVCMQSDKKVLESQTTMRFIEHAVYPDDTNVWIDTVKSPVFSDGELVGIIGNAVDITNNVPLIVKELHREASSIEINVNTTIGKAQLITFLERRSEPRIYTK